MAVWLVPSAVLLLAVSAPGHGTGEAAPALGLLTPGQWERTDTPARIEADGRTFDLADPAVRARLGESAKPTVHTDCVPGGSATFAQQITAMASGHVNGKGRCVSDPAAIEGADFSIAGTCADDKASGAMTVHGHCTASACDAIANLSMSMRHPAAQGVHAVTATMTMAMRATGRACPAPPAANANHG